MHIEAVGVGTVSVRLSRSTGYRLHTAMDAETLTAIAKATGGGYHPVSDTEQLDGVAATIDLRLTVAKQDPPVPLAGGFIAVLALALLAVGALLTGVRTGRVV